MRLCERKILNSEEVEKIMPLPEELKNKQVEVIVLDLEDNKKEKSKKIVSELRGAYKGQLSSSKEYSNRKKQEKNIENRKFKNE